MEWLLRQYRRVGTSTRYSCGDGARCALPPELTLTKPWAGRINADLVLSTYGERDALTGLRATQPPAGRPYTDARPYTGDILTGGRRRLLVAVVVKDAHGEPEYLLVALHRGLPRRRTQATADGIRELRALHHRRPPTLTPSADDAGAANSQSTAQ